MRIARLKTLWPWITVFALAVVVRLGILLALGTLWQDEAFSRYFALKPLLDIVGLLRHDVHPPLHALLLHVWMMVFGTTALAMRSMSFVAGVAGIVVFAFLSRTLLNRRAALLAFAAVAASPILAYYAADARMYALVFLLSCLSSLYFWRAAVKGEDGWRQAWFWTTFTLTMTHATGVAVVAAQAIFLLRDRERRASFRKFLPGMAVMGTVFLIWFVPLVLFRLQFAGQEWQFRAAQESIPAWQSLVYWLWLVKNPVTVRLAFAAFVLLMAAGAFRRSERRPFVHLTGESEYLLYWFACAFAPFLIFPNVTPRYLMCAIPPFFLLLAAGFVRAGGDRLRALVLGVAAIVLMAAPGVLIQMTVRPYNWDRDAAWIAERAGPGDRVVFAWFSDQPAMEAAADETHVSLPPMTGLYPFDDSFDESERLAAHAGTLAVRTSDLDRLAPLMSGANRIFFIPNDYITLSGGNWSTALNTWLKDHGWYLADHRAAENRTPGVWLMVKK